MKDLEKSAKINSLKKIKKEMEEAMKSGLGSKMKKVTVTSDSDEGLEKGLKKAKEIVEDDEDSEDEVTPFGGEETLEEEIEEHSMIEDAMDEDSDEEEDEEFEDAESIDEEIERLMALKEKLQS